MNITYQHGETIYHLNLENGGDGAYTVTINGIVHDIFATSLTDGAWLIQWDGGREVVHTARNGSERYAHAEGGNFTLTQPTPQTRKRKRAGGGDDLTAQMPGKVVDVLVAVGDVVKKGQTLVLLEAMKMEIRASAPNDGTIKAVYVQKGEVIDRGQRLVEIGE